MVLHCGLHVADDRQHEQQKLLDACSAAGVDTSLIWLPVAATLAWLEDHRGMLPTASPQSDGRLPERVRQRALAMADDADLRKRPPQSFTDQFSLAVEETTVIDTGRDPRLPPVGTPLYKT